MSKIESPNYTQIPNIVLDNLHVLTESEAKIMLAVCRQTFGYHQRKSRLSRAMLCGLTGLSENSVKCGIDGVIERRWLNRHPEQNSFSYSINLSEIHFAEDPEETPQNLTPLVESNPSKFAGLTPQNLRGGPLKICGENPSKFDPLLKERKKLLNKEETKTSPLPEEAEIWNSKEPLPKVVAFGRSRETKLRARRSEPFFREYFEQAVSRILASDFCMGKNDRGWKADFDWMLQPETCIKIMEGKYDNRTATNGSSRPTARQKTDAELLGEML